MTLSVPTRRSSDLEAVVHAVGDGTVVVEAGEDFLDLAHDVVGAGDVEEGFLLAGEGGVGQVLGGRGRTHRHGHVTTSVIIAQLSVGLAGVGRSEERRVGNGCGSTGSTGGSPYQ